MSQVTDMSRLFADLDRFNEPIGCWDVSSVTNMRFMFNDAPDFNQPLDSWDVSSVTNMQSMFDGASSFDQNLCAWGGLVDATSIDLSDVFQYSGCDDTTTPSPLPVIGVKFVMAAQLCSYSITSGRFYNRAYSWPTQRQLL